MDTKRVLMLFEALDVPTYEVHSREIFALLDQLLVNHDLLFWVQGELFKKGSSGNSTVYFNYTDTITDLSTSPQETYTINGVCSKTKVGNTTIFCFNGSGYKTQTIIGSDGKKIETTYKVISKMQGELCKNGNIKITLDEENGQTSKAIVDGKEITFNDLYSSESNFCLKKMK